MNMEPRNLSNTMTEEEYDCEREQLRETYGRGFGKAASVEARAKSDMALCQFFSRVEGRPDGKGGKWTQGRLAEKEKWSGTHIHRRLIFGRFVGYILSEGKIIPKNLTEARFRSYWSQTETGVRKGIANRQDQFPAGFGKEKRFDDVLLLIEEDTVARNQDRPKIGKEITEQFADGKWHDIATIAAEVCSSEDHVKGTLELMRQKRTYKHKAEHKEFGGTIKWRLFKEQELVGTDEIEKKLAEAIKALKAEGKKNMATMSPPSVLYWVGMIEKQIDEWADGVRDLKTAEAKSDFSKTGLRKVTL